MKNILTLILLTLAMNGIQAQTFSKHYNEAENKIKWPEAFDPKSSDFYVHNEIEIKATPERVWQLLTAAKAWTTWYGGIQNIRFENPSQEVLAKNTLVFWNSMGQNLNNQVVEFEPYRALAWEFKEPKIQGYHAWLIIPTETGCKVITDESQTGKLARLQKVFLPNKLIKQHDQWLRLLKQTAEK
jgi:uncharacterized protein YndB with AHSA1/START domain